MSQPIESVLHENRIFPVDPKFAATANIKSEAEYQAMLSAAANDYERYWAELARKHINWHTLFNQILDSSNAPLLSLVC